MPVPLGATDWCKKRNRSPADHLSASNGHGTIEMTADPNPATSTFQYPNSAGISVIGAANSVYRVASYTSGFVDLSPLSPNSY
jgi:hypothetical protein